MAYTPTVWETGDVITAEKLNKAENGIAGAYPVVLPITNDEHDTPNLGKSWNDLMELSGVPVFAQLDVSETDQNRYFLARLYTDNGSYYAAFVSVDGMKKAAYLEFSSASASDDLVLVD